MPQNTEPPEAASPDTFRAELDRLVELFGRNLNDLKSNSYDEASLRQEFLNPLFRALGWDLENKAGLIPQHREVELESRTEIAGRQKRADYLFRTDRQDRFVCEAKKPAEVLQARYAFQAKRYAWNKGLVLAVLTDFEETLVYVVGSKPHPEEAGVGLWKTWRFQEYSKVAEEIWDLLARPCVAAGSIDKLVQQLPRKATAKGKAKQQWLIKPDRSRALDTDFLNFLDEARRELASDLIRGNNREDLLEGTRLNEAVQHILDRLLFLRICEDRDIDTGRPLSLILKSWRDSAENPVPRRVRQSELLMHEDAAAYKTAARPAPRQSLWRDVVDHFRALDRRPPSHIPFFNGNLFKPHFSEELKVSDEWIAGFLDDVGDEESAYLFNVIPVEILGTIYERFLGKVVRPKGRGVTIEEKPEVRKAGGVYYTPRYIVDYIVEQTVGKLLAEQNTPQASLKLRILDPACGSGSFLIRAFERICEYWQAALMKDEKLRRKFDCWTDPVTGDIHLTTDLKRRILTANIYGVDIDAGAVEVTQLSLYLKMLEGENRTTLSRERDLFGSDIALLPPLQDNVKCGNSLIASDFSLVPEDLLRVKAFDWPIQFSLVMKAGGFDAVIGNPPYIRIQTLQESDAESASYLNGTYAAAKKGNYDIYVCFVERGHRLLCKSGMLGFILPHKFTNSEYGQPLRSIISAGRHLTELVYFGANQVFDGATTYTCLMFLLKAESKGFRYVRVDNLQDWAAKHVAADGSIDAEKVTTAPWSFSVGRDAKLVEQLKAWSPKLGEAADIFVGLQTSADDVLVMDFVAKRGSRIVLNSKAMGAEVELERELLHPLVSGTDIQGYDRFNCRQLILFPYSVSEERATLLPFAEIRRRAPKTAKYLETNRKRLEERERGKFADSEWYRFGRSQNLGIQERIKVCVPRLVDRLCAALDETGKNYLDNVDVGGVTFKSGFERHDLRYLTGLLNSRLLAWLFPNVSAPFRGGWMSANRQFLAQLPFRKIDFSNHTDRSHHDRVVELVDKMLTLMPKLRAARTDAERATLQNAVTATDRQIDALVYELYGLTPEEIELVEKS